MSDVVKHEYSFPSTNDRLRYNDGCRFSTRDADNGDKRWNMARKWEAPWCYFSYPPGALTGVYRQGTSWQYPSQHFKYAVVMIHHNG